MGMYASSEQIKTPEYQYQQPENGSESLDLKARDKSYQEKERLQRSVDTMNLAFQRC